VLALFDDVEPGGELDRGAPGDAIEARLLSCAELARTLGDLGHDRCRRFVDLGPGVGLAARQVGQDLVAATQDMEGAPIDVQLDMDMLEPAFDASTFSKNRARLMEHDVAAAFFFAIRAQASDLMSREHFSVDGTMIEAWASMKSFRPKDEEPSDNNGWGDFRGKPRKNDTHESKTDPEARLLRKGRGREAKLCLLAHALIKNRHGLLVDLRVSEAHGRAERDEALAMLAEHVAGRSSVGADRAYDTRGFVAGCRQRGVTPHVAQNENARRRSAIDGRTTRHIGYEISRLIRMRIESAFGWLKSVGGLRRTRFRGRRKTQFAAYLTGAAYNLLRVARLRTCAP